MKKVNKSRRNFLIKSAAASAGLFLGANVLGSSSRAGKAGPADRIRVGFIGIGNRGSQLLSFFMQQPDCEVAALCDVYEPYVLRDRSRVDPRYLKDRPGQIPKMGEVFPTKPAIYSDYRKLLEDKTIDAVCIATPDHWHAQQTIDAIKAGKDVYVEKPLTNTLVEGRKMVIAQKAANRVVAVGINRRATPVYQKLAKDVPAGLIGKVTVARSFHVSNMYPNGIGKMKPEQPPKDFNWDMWLGPRAYRPYQYNIAPYMFRWWSDYSSQMGNWGVHYMDATRWVMGELAPSAVIASGGRYAVDDDRPIPDTMQVTFEFASGAMAVFSIYEANSGDLFDYGDIEFRGTKGNLYTSERGYRITGSKRGQFQTWTKQMDDVVFDAKSSGLLADGSDSDSTSGLVRNFLDCIKSRQNPYCTLEDGHRSTSFAHLANISLALKQRLEWDAVNEKFTNSEKANEMLGYEYRKPWKI